MREFVFNLDSHSGSFLPKIFIVNHSSLLRTGWLRVLLSTIPVFNFLSTYSIDSRFSSSIWVHVAVRLQGWSVGKRPSSGLD